MVEFRCTGGEMEGVFRADLFGDVHAVVADEVVDHFQPVEKFSFIERLAPQIEPYLVENFFVLDAGEVGLLRFSVVFS